MPCELLILLPSIAPPSASTGCSRCWTVSRAAPGYPPYNIERTGENDYRITVAVAGFGENELSIEAKENTLTIKGAKQVKEDKRRGALSGHRRPRLRAPLPARRPRRGEGRAASRTASCTSISCAKFPRPRSRARSRSATARQAAGGRGQSRGLTPQLQSPNGSTPGCPRGAFVFKQTEFSAQFSTGSAAGGV